VPEPTPGNITCSTGYAMLAAAKVLAGSIVDLLTTPNLKPKAAETFRQGVTGAAYAPLLPAGQKPRINPDQAEMAKGKPSLSGAPFYEDLIYVIRNGILLIFDPKTGNLLKQSRVKDAAGEYWASPIAGDGKIHLVSLEGKVSVLKAGLDWEVLSGSDLDEQVIAMPAIAGRRVYMQTGRRFYCFRVEHRDSPAASPLS
jgi:hypothetical protein